VAIRLAEDLQQHKKYGIDPVGFVDSVPRVDPAMLPAPLLGGYVELSELIEDFAVGVVMVGFGNQREADLVDILRTCDRLDCEIFIVPRLFEVHTITRDMDQVWGLPLVRVRRAPFRSVSWQVKRLGDVLASGLALVALSPVLAACAIAVRLEGGPGILFRQVRVGLDGAPFELLKFRSLKPVDETESATNWNIKHDDRLGPVGRFLRKSSLDELPQLWNILQGDMSLVGPRPERPHFVDEFTSRVPRYMARHRVPAGLTGWAQVHGLRGDTSIRDRASFDNYYIENWSLWGDVKIMVRTINQVLFGRGG
jgi:exopolysaccharide biosynthesis polyprenyl glycosylphosphotransferase